MNCLQPILTAPANSRRLRFFVIAQTFYLRLPAGRWAEDYTVVEGSDLIDAVQAVMDADGPEAVYAIDIVAGTAKDVSKDVALHLACLIRDGEADLEINRDFIEHHFMPGELVPAAV